MDFENEKKQEEQQVDSSASREGYQKEFRPVGRSPRPRIHTGQRPVNYERAGFNKQGQEDEGGFRPEGFGAGLQSSTPQRPSFRPRQGRMATSRATSLASRAAISSVAAMASVLSPKVNTVSHVVAISSVAAMASVLRVASVSVQPTTIPMLSTQ